MIILSIISLAIQPERKTMKKTNINSKKGFTIIEVVLVLAIAGLIFLMVFVALPNLQRTQRDTQRRNDLDRLSTSLTQYITNNNKLPNDGTGPGSVFLINLTTTDDAKNTNPWYKFAKNYLLAEGNDTFQDPNGDPYYLDVANSAGSANLANFGGNDKHGSAVMVVAPKSRCNAEVDASNNPFEPANGNRNYAVAMRLEGNGIYCVDNS